MVMRSEAGHHLLIAVTRPHRWESAGHGRDGAARSRGAEWNERIEGSVRSERARRLCGWGHHSDKEAVTAGGVIGMELSEMEMTPTALIASLYRI
jgi:hypothetical protein